MRRAARIDKVQPEIVEGLRARSIIVVPMPQPGDILCFGVDRLTHTAMFVPMEIKSDQKTRGYKKELTPAQQRRADSGMPIPVVHSIAEALALFGIIS